jgi:general secretion pathway protein D
MISKNIYDNPNLKPIISLDDELNALIVKASYEDMNDIKILIEELDKEKAQVYVQAKIIEVNDEMVDKIGISYGVFGGAVGSNGLATFSSSLNGGSDSIFVVPDTIGLKIPDIKSGLALGATLNLLKQNGALDIVSEPSILAINNKESSIYVGEKISIKFQVQKLFRNERTNFQRNVGLTLKVNQNFQ